MSKRMLDNNNLFAKSIYGALIGILVGILALLLGLNYLGSATLFNIALPTVIGTTLIFVFLLIVGLSIEKAMLKQGYPIKKRLVFQISFLLVIVIPFFAFVFLMIVTYISGIPS